MGNHANAGQVRFEFASPNPGCVVTAYDGKVEVCQNDGTWIPLRICGCRVTIESGQIGSATLDVEFAELRGTFDLSQLQISHGRLLNPKRSLVDHFIVEWRNYSTWRAFLRTLRRSKRARGVGR